MYGRKRNNPRKSSASFQSNETKKKKERKNKYTGSLSHDNDTWIVVPDWVEHCVGVNECLQFPFFQDRRKKPSSLLDLDAFVQVVQLHQCLLSRPLHAMFDGVEDVVDDDTRLVSGDGAGLVYACLDEDGVPLLVYMFVEFVGSSDIYVLLLASYFAIASEGNGPDSGVSPTKYTVFGGPSSPNTSFLHCSSTRVAYWNVPICGFPNDVAVCSDFPVRSL
jgi:hypothetical protein